jgi:hypothetical protein
LKCIQKWAERVNSCPLCKKKFSKITPIDSKGVQNGKILKIENKNLQHEEDVDTVVCDICNTVIHPDQFAKSCDLCYYDPYISNESFVHLECAKLNKLVDPNTDEYICSHCTSILRCKSCSRIFHDSSGIMKSQFKKFQCPFCATGKENEL